MAPVMKYKIVRMIIDIISGRILAKSIFITSVLFSAEIAWVGVISPMILIG